MGKTRLRWTRFSKGELSPLLAGSSDLAQYFEGVSVAENFKIMRQGGATRWEGTRFIKEVKDSSQTTILWPFEFSVADSYMLEVGNLYIRVYKNKAPVISGVHVEIVTPFTAGDVREIHITQSADVVFTFHTDYQQRKLSRVSDTSWALTTTVYSPPPSFLADTDLATPMAIRANTGTGLEFRTEAGVLLAGDVGRLVIVGAGRATIASVLTASSGTVDIIDPFAQTITAGVNTVTTVGTAAAIVAHGILANDYIALTSGPQVGQLRRVSVVVDANNVTLDVAFSANQVAQTWNKILKTPVASWAVRLSPQATLDPNKKGPVDATVTLVAGAAAFRAADVGKYVKIYGGVVRLTVFNSSTIMTGLIEGVMGEATVDDPPAALAGNWTLEQASWSSTKGYPRTGEFFQGRLVQASTPSQPTTWWQSASDDFDNYALGITAQDAVEYTMASRQVNRIEWVTEKNKALFIGTAGSEHQATGSGNTEALIGGDTIPQLDRLATNGCAGIQPLVARQSILYVDRSRRKLMMMGFDLDSDGQTDKELTVGSEHITKSMVRLGPMALEKRLDPRVYFAREDGQLVGVTFFPEQKVVAFTRRTTQGEFQCSAAIPNSAGGRDQIWCVTFRFINLQSKMFVEMFEPEHELLQNLSSDAQAAMQTDCGIVQTGITGTTVSGLSHLEGAIVDVIKNGSALPQRTVVSGTITMETALVAGDVVEVGLHYDSTLTTMEPAVQSQIIDGVPRTWDSLFVRLHESKGGKINGEPIQYPPDLLDDQSLFTGIRKVSTQNVDESGKVTILQDQPYHMTITGLFGTLTMGEMD
jgi:hypothetical protein